MTLTDAQEKALIEVRNNVLLEENKRGRGHMYDLRGKNKLVDARTVVALEDKGLIQ